MLVIGILGSVSPGPYAKFEKVFRAYLTKLNVPMTIVDRLFATDSKHVYYLTLAEASEQRESAELHLQG
jgi:hypothetical protein